MNTNVNPLDQILEKARRDAEKMGEEPEKNADNKNRFFTPEEYFQNPETDKDNLPENVFGNLSTEEIVELRAKYYPKKPEFKKPEELQFELFKN